MTHFLLISGGASTKMRCLCCQYSLTLPPSSDPVLEEPPPVDELPPGLLLPPPLGGVGVVPLSEPPVLGFSSVLVEVEAFLVLAFLTLAALLRLAQFKIPVARARSLTPAMLVVALKASSESAPSLFLIPTEKIAKLSILINLPHLLVLK